jgi:hypothetical protein
MGTKRQARSQPLSRSSPVRPSTNVEERFSSFAATKRSAFSPPPGAPFGRRLIYKFARERASTAAHLDFRSESASGSTRARRYRSKEVFGEAL